MSFFDSGPVPQGSASSRIRLYSPLTLYRSPTGVDSGDCLSASTPGLTRDYIWNLLVNKYDLNGQSVVIQDADGTYTDSFNAKGNPLGNNGFEQIIFQGNPANDAAVIWQAASGTNMVLQSAGPGTAPAFTVRHVFFKGATSSPDTIITTTDGADLLLENVIFGCNPGKIDINTGTNSIVHISDYAFDPSECSGIATITTSIGSPNISFTVASGPGPKAGDHVSDPTNVILPGTTYLSVDAGAGTAVLSTNATATAGPENTYYVTAALNHLQMDPQSQVDFQGSTINSNGGTNYARGQMAQGGGVYYGTTPLFPPRTANGVQESP